MPLLDLPPEIFQHITHDLVSATGPGGAWEYRTICRTFAAEIAHDVFAKSDQDAFKTKKDLRILERGLDIFLLNRLDSPRDVNSAVIAKITTMIDWLMTELDIEGKKAREKCAENLCRGLIIVVKPTDIIHALWCGHTGCHGSVCSAWQHSSLSVYDKLLAAIACKEYGMIGKLLPQCLDPGVAEHGRNLCNPLSLSMGGRTFEREGRRPLPTDERLLKLVLECLKDLDLQSKDNKALAYSAAIAYNAKFKIWAAIVNAIEDYEYDIFVQLLDFHLNHLPRPDRSYFTEWLSYAIHYRHEDMVQLLIDFTPGGKPMLLRKNLLEAFRGNQRIIEATLAKLNITDMNAGNISTIPLFMAVRSGKVAAVQIMLKQGSDPNVTAVSNMTSLNKLRVTPLDVALYHKFISVARCLLQNGADVPHISEWPTHRACYECLRDWEMKKTGAQIPTWSAARRLRNMGELEWLEY